MARYVDVDQGLLAMALVGYESEKVKVEAAIAEIRAKLGQRAAGRPRAAANEAEPAGAKPRTLSAAARRRISMAQKKRWATLKKAKATPQKRTRKLSAAGRKAIVAALRKRWATVRQAKAQKLKARKAGAKTTKDEAKVASAAT